jgi:hypothetical protein
MKYEVIPYYYQPGNISRSEWLSMCSNNKIPIFVQQLDNKMDDFIKIKLAIETAFQTNKQVKK